MANNNSLNLNASHPLIVINGGTGLSSTTANQLLYSSATNTIAGLATAANGILITSGASVPSIASTLPTAVQSNITQLGTLLSLVTAPAVSADSSLAIGSAYQNVLGYDVLLVVYISAVSAVSASFLCGSGPTNTPTQQTIISSLTASAVNIITIPVYLPAGYYALISTSGTVTAVISGQQVIPI